MTSRTVRRALVLSLVGLVLAGCTRVLDAERLELEIGLGIEEQTGISVASVECPDDRPIEPGDTFTCIVRDDRGETARVEVTQQDDRGNVRWELVGEGPSP